jgi:hypothetical protein
VGRADTVTGRVVVETITVVIAATVVIVVIEETAAHTGTAVDMVAIVVVTAVGMIPEPLKAPQRRQLLRRHLTRLRQTMPLNTLHTTVELILMLHMAGMRTTLLTISTTQLNRQLLPAVSLVRHLELAPLTTAHMLLHHHLQKHHRHLLLLEVLHPHHQEDRRLGRAGTTQYRHRRDYRLKTYWTSIRLDRLGFRQNYSATHIFAGSADNRLL